MATAVFFVEQIATGLYILIGVGIVWASRNWMRARGAYRATHFELERGLARYRRGNSATILLLLLQLGLLVLGIQRIVAPAVRERTDTTQTVTRVTSDGVFSTPTPFLASGVDIDASDVVIDPDLLNLGPLQTPTLTPTPVGTIQAAPPPIGCTSPEATLQIPANGMVVFEPVNVVGTATTTDFAFYRFELSGPSTGNNFAILQEYTQTAPGRSELGQFVPSFYQPGQYQFRLAVFDVANALRAECTVNIFITEPIPTPTPIGR